MKITSSSHVYYHHFHHTTETGKKGYLQQQGIHRIRTHFGRKKLQWLAIPIFSKGIAKNAKANLEFVHFKQFIYKVFDKTVLINLSFVDLS